MMLCLIELAKSTGSCPTYPMHLAPRQLVGPVGNFFEGSVQGPRGLESKLVQIQALTQNNKKGLELTWHVQFLNIKYHQIHQYFYQHQYTSRTWFFPGFDQHQIHQDSRLTYSVLKTTKKPPQHHGATFNQPAQGTRLEVLHVMAVHLAEMAVVTTKIPMAGW